MAFIATDTIIPDVITNVRLIHGMSMNPPGLSGMRNAKRMASSTVVKSKPKSATVADALKALEKLTAGTIPAVRAIMVQDERNPRSL